MAVPAEFGTSTPNASIIIPVFNDQRSLDRCLRAILNQQFDGLFEVIVVDNGPHFSLDAFVTRYPSVTFLWEPQPGSYAARNHGLERANGEILAFTDADCKPDTHWLAKGIKALDSNPHIGFVGGQVVIEPSEQRSSLAEMFDLVVGFPQQSHVERGRYAATANMISRRSVFASVGLFDSQLMSGGDAEWGARVVAAGYQAVYAADAIVFHPARRTSEEVLKKFRRTVGGTRSRHPSWSQCLRFVLRHLGPPRRWIMAAWRDRRLPVWARLSVMGYSIFVNWMCAYERMRLQLTKSSSPRS